MFLDTDFLKNDEIQLVLERITSIMADILDISKKTCEYIGGNLVEVAELPEGNDMRDRGELEKCIYKFDIGAL